MVSINNLSVSFSGTTLLNDINFMINENDRIGLVGKNGAGKSTLLKVIIGLQQPSVGSVSAPPDFTIGYLPQQMLLAGGKTVLEEAMLAFEELNALEKKIEDLTNEVTIRTDYESDDYMTLLEKLHETTERLNILGGINKEGDSEQTLIGLGFKREDLNRPTTEFSGGWRMRIELAKILLKRPNLLLLDEPTNHLDIESIQWLEDYLKNYPGALILISHDRAFLDAITNRTIEILLGKVNDYKTSYTHYVELRRERLEQQKATYENQRKVIEKTEDFIERFRYKASKSNQVQSRIKHLEKLDIVEIDDVDTSRLNMKFPPAPRAGQIIFEAKDLKKQYGSHIVFQNADIIIERGEKVALVGRNGEGKSTLSKIIINELEHEAGEAIIGHNVKIGYFAQSQDGVLLDEDTVFETLDRIAVGDIRTKLRDILGAFLFRGDDVDKKVKVLSGGEKSRLSMARLMLEPYNLLVLDEPTNHMDMLSKDILKQALQNYDGTMVIVSHDREFLEGLVNKVYEFRDGKVKEHLGGIKEFLERRKLENLKEIERKNIIAKTKEAPVVISKENYEEQRQYEREIKRIENKIKREEELIEKLESEISAMDKNLANNSENIEESFYNKYQSSKKELEKAMRNWEKHHEELNSIS